MFAERSFATVSSRHPSGSAVGLGLGLYRADWMLMNCVSSLDDKQWMTL